MFDQDISYNLNKWQMCMGGGSTSNQDRRTVNKKSTIDFNKSIEMRTINGRWDLGDTYFNLHTSSKYCKCYSYIHISTSTICTCPWSLKGTYYLLSNSSEFFKDFESKLVVVHMI